MSRNAMPRRFLPLLAAMIVAIRPTPAQAQDPVAKELVRLEDSWGAMDVKHDGTGIGKLLASDYVFTRSDGRVVDKAEFIKIENEGKTVVVSGGNTEYKTHVHGNTAVITGLWTSVVKGDKGNETHRYRWTDTWMKQTNGSWLCIASQSMEVK